MNNAAHVATGGEVSDHHRQEAPSIAKLGYQWRLVQMAKTLKLEIYSVIFSDSRGDGYFNHGNMEYRYILSIYSGK